MPEIFRDRAGLRFFLFDSILPREAIGVTKKDIVRIVSERLDQTQLLTKEIVQKTFDVIIETLVGAGRIELRNFGVFEVKRRAARIARNPRTGQEVKVDEKFIVTFKPGKEMEEQVQEKSQKKSKKRKK